MSKRDPTAEAIVWGDALTKRLESMGISGADLGRMLKVSRSTVSGWCTGRVAPSPQHEAALVRHVGVLPDVPRRRVGRPRKHGVPSCPSCDRPSGGVCCDEQVSRDALAWAALGEAMSGGDPDTSGLDADAAALVARVAGIGRGA